MASAGWAARASLRVGTVITTNSARISVGSVVKYWDRPPHTPASLRLVRLRYNLRVSAGAAFREVACEAGLTVHERVCAGFGAALKDH